MRSGSRNARRRTSAVPGRGGESQGARPTRRTRRDRSHDSRPARSSQRSTVKPPGPAREATTTPTRKTRNRRTAVDHHLGPGSAPGRPQAHPAVAGPEVPEAGALDRNHATGSAVGREPTAKG
eukprot:8547800-Heterocapsa_arctica.AAC.1